MKVLVADDNPNSRQLVKDILEAVGYEPLLAQDGPTALKVAQSQMPDLIILDVNMPGMTGFEVCSILKSDPQMAAIPVIILTALADIENRLTGLGLGADDYLTKPFSPRELAARVDQRLRSKVEADTIRKAQERIRATFESYLVPSVLDRLLQAPLQVKLEGSSQETSILTLDLQDIPEIAAQTTPEKAVSTINSYHGLIVSIIQSYAGTIEFIATNRMAAIYNAPLKQEDHAIRAVRTALQIREAIKDFHQQFEAEFRLKVRFALHTGSLVLGKIGTQAFNRYRATGVALTATNQLLNKAADGQILLSHEMNELVKDQVKTALVPALGSSVYEVLDAS